MTDEIHVRVGTPDDVEDVMNLALYATNEMALTPPNPHKMLMDIWPALTREAGIVGIIGKRGHIEGGILLKLSGLWYSDSLILEEKGLFISPDYRGAKGGRARRLCEFAKKTADELGLPLVVGVFSNTNTEGKVRLYQRIFGQPAGALFLYNGKTGSWNKSEENTAEPEVGNVAEQPATV